MVDSQGKAIDFEVRGTEIHMSLQLDNITGKYQINNLPALPNGYRYEYKVQASSANCWDIVNQTVAFGGTIYNTNDEVTVTGGQHIVVAVVNGTSGKAVAAYDNYIN